MTASNYRSICSSHVLDLLERVNGFVQILAGIGEVYPLSESQTKELQRADLEGAEIRISGLDNDVDLAAQELALKS